MCRLEASIGFRSGVLYFHQVLLVVRIDIDFEQVLSSQMLYAKLVSLDQVFNDQTLRILVAVKLEP